MVTKAKPFLHAGIGVALFLLLWQLASDAGYLDPFFFSSPLLVLGELQEMLGSGQLARHVPVTLREAALGLLFGGVLGGALGLWLGCRENGGQGLMAVLSALNGVPKLALGPLFILWFGIGLKSKAILSALMVFFVFVMNLYSGARAVNRDWIAAAVQLGASRSQIICRVICPACVPWLLAGLRTGIGLAMSGAVVGEYLGAGRGLGWMISNAGERYNVEQVLCCVLVIAAVIAVLEAVLRIAESLLRKKHYL